MGHQFEQSGTLAAFAADSAAIVNSSCRSGWRMACACVCLLIVFSGQCYAQDASPERSELPKLEDLQRPPAADELMTRFDKDDLYDWIVVSGGQVIVVKPLWPRPDTLKKMAEEREQLENSSPQSQAEREERTRRLRQLRRLELELFDDSATIFSIPVTSIEQVICFEDFMLERADILLTEGEIAKAYELLRRVESVAPGWDKTAVRFENLLLREAELRQQDGNVYAAMALLDELAARNIQNQQLPIQYGQLVEPSIRAVVDAKDYAQARYLITRLSRHFPEHEVVQRWRGQLQGASKALLDQAAQLTGQRQFAEAARLAQQAEEVWATSGNDRSAFTQIFARHQIVRVSVRRFADSGVVSPVPLEADERHRELTIVPLFEPSGADEITYFQSSFFEKWDPTDLGRQVVFSLRTTRPYWQSQPILSANQIADTLSNQLNPLLPTFNSRLASFVREFSVRSPTELQIEFSRVPLNIEALFRFPLVGAPDTVSTDDGTSAVGNDAQILSTRFQLVNSDATRRVYHRTIAEPDGLNGPQYHVAEIVEQKYDSRHEEIQAFVRGEIDVMPHLQPWEVDAFKASGLAFVQQYALPRNDVIVFNPMSESVRSTQLRRALSLSINRDAILKNIILKDDSAKYGRVSSSAWHTQSYASNPLVEDPVYDVKLAFALKFAAEEQLKIPDKLKFIAEAKARAIENKEEFDEEVFRRDHADEIKAAVAHITLPKLRMVCVPDESAIAAAEKMISVWSKIGLDVELIPADRAGDPMGDADWDFMYRRVSMKEPLLELWPLMTTDNSFDIDRLSAYPDWMRQELINLDYATSFLDAQDKLFTIHRHIAAQAFLIPLWEVDDFAAYQRNISGFSEEPLTTYHNVERWAVKP